MQKDSQVWNSEQAQVERLRQAGLNPALAFGNSSAGSAVGTPSASGSPAAQASGNPVMQPMDFSSIGSIFSNMIMQALQQKKAQAEIDNINAQTTTIQEQNNILRDMLNEQLAGMKANRKNTEANTLWTNTMMPADYNKRVSEAANIDQLTKLYESETICQNLMGSKLAKELKWFDQQAWVNLSLQLSQIDLNKASAKDLIADAYLKQAQTQGVYISNKYADEMASETIAQIKANTDLTNQKTATEEWNTTKTKNNRFNTSLVGASYDFTNTIMNLFGVNWR